MYVVLQGIGSLPCIRVYIIYVIPFGEQQSWMSEVCKLERFNKKNRSPEMINIFYIVPVVPHKAVAEVSKIGNL